MSIEQWAIYYYTIVSILYGHTDLELLRAISLPAMHENNMIHI